MVTVEQLELDLAEAKAAYEKLQAETELMKSDVKAGAGFIKALLDETKLLDVFKSLKSSGGWKEVSLFQKMGIIKSVTGGVTSMVNKTEAEMNELFPENTMEIVERFIQYAEA